MSTTARRSSFDRAHYQQFPASWATYQRLLKDRGDRDRPKYTFFNGRLTIVSPGSPHETLKKRVSGLIEDICIDLRIPFLGFGSTTYLKSAKPRAGTEPDESYYLTNIDLIRAKEHIVMGQDPAPDLVVEVVASHPLGDTLEVYRRFGVREVWVCKRSKLLFLVLGPDGRYAPTTTSACLPFLKADELNLWAYRHDLPNESELRYQFRAWVTETLAPRVRPA
jgi:Uma2 family endonuclease